MSLFSDTDNQETQEWLASLSSVIEAEGTERAHFLIEAMIDQALSNIIPAVSNHLAVAPYVE